VWPLLGPPGIAPTGFGKTTAAAAAERAGYTVIRPPRIPEPDDVWLEVEHRTTGHAAVGRPTVTPGCPACRIEHRQRLDALADPLDLDLMQRTLTDHADQAHAGGGQRDDACLACQLDIPPAELRRQTRRLPLGWVTLAERRYYLGTHWGSESAPALGLPAVIATARQRFAQGAEPVWEKCQGPCNGEYEYPHLCREHLLCGYCHPPIDSRSPACSGPELTYPTDSAMRVDFETAASLWRRPSGLVIRPNDEGSREPS
jgi:hypothetical protein